MTDRLAKLCETAWFCFVTVCVFSFLTVTLPVLIGGLHASGDLSVWLGFAQEVRFAIEQGRYFPGWANDALGYGSVGIRLYPPVGYYFAALVSLVVGDWYTTVCIFLFFWMVVGCWGVFLFAREFISPHWALAAAGLYSIVPFHLAEIYQFTLYGEFAAGGVLPYCFLYATRLCRDGKLSHIVGFAAFCAALILTHIPTTLIGAASLLIFISIIIERRRIGRTVANLVVSALIALAASSFYWIRLVTEVDWVAHAQPEYSAVLGGRENWFFPYVLSAANAPDFFRPVLRSFDAMVVLTAAMLIPAVFVFASRIKLDTDCRRILKGVSTVATVGLFMLSYASYFVWDRVEILQRIQFPWRWLTVVSVVAVVIFTIGNAALFAAGGIRRKIAAAYLIAVIGLIVAYDYRKSFMFGNVVSSAEFARILTAGNNPAGSNFAVWWPVWAKPEALSIPDKVIANGRVVEILEWKAESREFRVEAGEQGTARIATFYYPHWRATINGRPAEIKKDENGAILIDLPADAVNVRLKFDEPGLNSVFLILSIFTWLLVAAGLIIILLKKNRAPAVSSMI